jgi:TonB-linked SusC/RagA family outer membrane protein
MRKNLLSRFLALFLVSVASFVVAQERTITGKVIANEDGSALPGVNILVKGTNNGTVSDVDGKFIISVSGPNDILIFSFIGYKSQEIQVGQQTSFDVKLASDVETLSEVVVTAAGIERDKKALSYAVQNVKSDQIIQKSEPDVLRSLQGKVPGLSIQGSGGIAGSSTRITMRGVNSFLGNNQPLFVVDGIPYNNDLNNTSNPRDAGALAASRIADLDPNNIASVTTLNGGAAAALYGTRAANGVIVITTKTGSSKVSRKGLEGSFSSSYSIERVANLPDYQNKYGPGSQSVFAHANGTWGPAFSTRDSIAFYPGYVEAFPQLYAVSGSPVAALNGTGIMTPYKAIPGNVENFFKNGSVFENSFSLSGGSEKATISAVVSDMKQDGFIPNARFNRTNISLGGNAQLDNGIILGSSIQYTKSSQSGPLVGGDGTSPFARLLFQPRNWPLQDLPFINPANGRSVYFFPFGSGVDNPYWSVQNNLFNSDVDRLALSFNVGRDITDWLNITYRVGFNTFNDRRRQVINKGSASGAQNIGSVVLDNIYFGELESNFLVTFNKKINTDFSLKAILGHNYNERTNDRQSISSLGIIANNIFDIDNTTTVQPNGGTYNQRKLWAVYTDVTVGYKDFAFINASLRNDNSSTLPANNRSYFYYAATGSLILTEALQLKSNILTSAKIRGGFSRTGRDASPYQLFNAVTILNNDGFGSTQFPFGGIAGATIPNSSFNAGLKPEFTDEIEFGGNFDFFNGRLTLDATYYDRLSTNIIAQRAVPGASGFTSIFANFGAIRNTGWEIGLNATPVQLSNGLRWNAGFAFTRNVNLVESLTEGVTELSIEGVFTNATSVARPGYPMGVIRGTVAARDSQGRLLIDQATGLTIPDTEQRIIADPYPRFNLGWTNTISYKGFTLSALIEWRNGGQMYSQTTAFLLGRGTTRDTENRDIPYVVPGVLGNPNTLQPITDANGNAIPNTIQVMANNLWFQAQGGGSFAINAPTEFSIFDATTYRLRELTLGYDLPKSLLKNTFLSGINISLSGRNLWYIAPYFPKYTNFDPEVSSLGASNAQGFDINAAPTTRRYGVNIRLTF